MKKVLENDSISIQAAVNVLGHPQLCALLERL
jgi:hypothetical protein